MQKFQSVVCLALICALPALTACSSARMSMPTGYTYQNEVYKAPPGRAASPPSNLGKTSAVVSPGGMTAPMDGDSPLQIVDAPAEMTTDGNTITTPLTTNDGPDPYHDMADSLVQRMIENFGRPMEPVLVPASSAMAQSLKDSLVRHEIPVALNPGDGPFVLENAIDGANASITFFSNHDRVTSEAGTYPASGQ